MVKLGRSISCVLSPYDMCPECKTWLFHCRPAIYVTMVFAVFVRTAFSLLIVSPVFCLAQSTPTEVWAQRYVGPPSSGQDQGSRILRDNKGDVLVFGTTLDRNGSSDFVTIKYSGTDGSMLWSRRYDSPNKLDEHIGGLARWMPRGMFSSRVPPARPGLSGIYTRPSTPAQMAASSGNESMPVQETSRITWCPSQLIPREVF